MQALKAYRLSENVPEGCVNICVLCRAIGKQRKVMRILTGNDWGTGRIFSIYSIEVVKWLGPKWFSITNPLVESGANDRLIPPWRRCVTEELGMPCEEFDNPWDLSEWRQAVSLTSYSNSYKQLRNQLGIYGNPQPILAWGKIKCFLSGRLAQ